MELRLNNQKFLFFLCALFLGSLVFACPVFSKEKFVTVVNPVRGSDFWTNKEQMPMTMPKELYKKLTELKIPATWLLRFDSLLDSEITGFFERIDKSHELGLFLEITPRLAEASKVNYPQGGLFWHDSNKVFLSGYSLEDRKKLIDEAFYIFRYNFGYYPAVVGAWHIDAFSANYMAKEYQVFGILTCADQFTTDSYQIWGGFWGMPYYPSKFNILSPAQTVKNKIRVVVLQWAQRDPYLGYGGFVHQSNYSFQINDYYSRNLGIDYFNHLLGVYLENSLPFGQVTLGLENDYPWIVYKEGFFAQLEEIKKREDVKTRTAGQFVSWYMNNFLKLSPEGKVEGSNYFDKSQKAIWQFSPQFRIGITESNSEKKIRDLRVYNENWPEPNLLVPNPWPDLNLELPAKIDTVRFPAQERKLNFEVSYTNLIKEFGKQLIPFKFNNFFLLFFYFLIFFTLLFFLRQNVFLLILLVLGTLSVSIPLIKSGLIYPFGMGFWGPNGHDGIWHLALINQLAKFSLENPVFAGEKLTNYHLGFDFLVATICRITKISPVNLYFQIFPPIMAILIGFLTYLLIKKWTKSKRQAWWATFFVYFGGSWGWLLGKGESTFWANQAISTLINPPYALSLIFLLLGLIKLLDFMEKSIKKNLLICSLIFGVLVQIKVYAGIIVLVSLACLFLSSLIFYPQKSRDFLKLFLSTLLVALVVFLPLNLKAPSLLVFSPLWFPRTMLAYGDRLGWFRLENARVAYLNSGKWLRWILTEVLALAIFIFGNLGTRFVGFFYGVFFWKKRMVSEIEIFLFSALIFCLILPLTFIQKNNPWNTIQFFYYSQFFAAILAGVIAGKLKPGKVSALIGIFLVIFTLPTSFITLKNDYLPSRPPARVSISELEALNFLKNLPEGTVLSYPFREEWKSFFPEPKPLYAYETTAYISALSGKQSFLADEMNLEITGYPWRQRKELIDNFFKSKNKEWGRNFLFDNKIKYIYLVKGQKMEFGEGDIGAEKIFENGEVKIYKIN